MALRSDESAGRLSNLAAPGAIKDNFETMKPNCEPRLSSWRASMVVTPALHKQAVRCKCGYRWVTALLQHAGVGKSITNALSVFPEGYRNNVATGRIESPQKQPKRRRLWLNDNSIIRLRPAFANHVWSYDFMEDRAHNGVKFRILPAPYRRYR